jgi:glutathione S-transferase
MLRLYYSKGSCALASHIALEDAGADFEAVRIDAATGDTRRPEFLALNPKGRVPALVTDRGLLTENTAILAFIAQSHPQARLAPLDDPFAFAQAQAFNGYIASTVHVAYAHRFRGYRWADEQSSFDDMRRKVPEAMAACMQLIEKELLTGPWVLGEAYSICDPYLFTIEGWLEGDGVNIERFPKLAGHYARMLERPAVQRVLEREATAPGLFSRA